MYIRCWSPMMTCLTSPNTTFSCPTEPRDLSPEIHRIRERLRAGEYDRPELLDQLADRLSRMIGE